LIPPPLERLSRQTNGHRGRILDQSAPLVSTRVNPIAAHAGA
jgi:hypothetical protein